jgi:hypothetical protein
MIIPGVSICSIGLARGHDLLCDATLLSQLQQEINRKGHVPVKLNHRGGLDSVIGWIENARLGAGKLIGDLELCKSSPSYNFVRELVSKFSSTFGLSCAFSGAAEPLPDGNTAARCRELHSIDLVEAPASNPNGLFSARYNDRVIEFSVRPAVLTLATEQRAELSQLRRRVAALYLWFDAMQQRRRFVDDDDETQGHDDSTSIGHDLLAGAADGSLGAIAVDNLIHGSGSVVDRLRTIGGELRNPIESGLLRKIGIGAGVGSVLTAGAGILISKLAADRRKKQQARKQFLDDSPGGRNRLRGAEIGAVTGGALGATVGGLALRKYKMAPFGAAATGARGLLAGAILGALIGTKRKPKKKEPVREFSRGLTAEEQRDRSLYRVAGYKHRISEDELNRAASSYTSAGATGALAGALIGSLKSKAKIGAGIGALAGIGSIKAIREASPADPFGQHTPEEKAAEKAVPITAGIVAAIAARKKLKQITSRAAENIGRGLARGTRLFP